MKDSGLGLIKAAKNGDANELKKIFFEQKTTRSAFASLGTAFYWAVFYGHTDLALLLFHYGLRSEGWINLTWQVAFRLNNLLLEKFLLYQGANPTANNRRCFRQVIQSDNPLTIITAVCQPELLPPEIENLSLVHPFLAWNLFWIEQ